MKKYFIFALIALWIIPWKTYAQTFICPDYASCSGNRTNTCTTDNKLLLARSTPFDIYPGEYQFTGASITIKSDAYTKAACFYQDNRNIVFFDLPGVLEISIKNLSQDWGYEPFRGTRTWGCFASPLKCKFDTVA